MSVRGDAINGGRRSQAVNIAAARRGGRRIRDRGRNTERTKGRETAFQLRRRTRLIETLENDTRSTYYGIFGPRNFCA